MEWARMADELSAEVYAERNGVLVKGTGTIPIGSPVKIIEFKTK